MTKEEAKKEIRDNFTEVWADGIINALEQQPIIDVSNVTHKIAEFFSNWDGDENAKMEISVDNMREIAFVYIEKARTKRQLKEKALEKEPCEDAINREQAIDAVSNLFEMSEYPHPYPQGKPIRLRDIKEKLKQLPPVQPKPKTGHWIPVSERLPSDCNEDWVLVQIQEDNGYLWIPRVAEYRKNKDDWFAHDVGWLKRHDGAFKVIAWMPLPEPYKPQESEEANGTH